MVIRLDVDGRWTIDDLDAVGRQIDMMLGDRPCLIDIIIDFKGSNLTPEHVIPYTARLTDPRNPRFRRIKSIVLVNASKLIEALYHAFIKTYGGSGVLAERISFVASLAEARQRFNIHENRGPATSSR